MWQMCGQRRSVSGEINRQRAENEAKANEGSHRRKQQIRQRITGQSVARQTADFATTKPLNSTGFMEAGGIESSLLVPPDATFKLVLQIL